MPSLPKSLPGASVIGNVPIGLTAIGLVAVIVAFDAIKYGTRKAAVLCIAAPLTVLLYTMLLSARFVGPTVLSLHSNAAQLGIIGAIFVILFILLYRIVPESVGSGSLLLQAIGAALASVAVLFVSWMQLPPLMTLWTPFQTLQMIFGIEYRFFWLAGAYILLALMRR